MPNTHCGAPNSAASGASARMARVVVDVMPKPEILDPQGKAVAGALARLGFTEFAGARQGKRFEVEIDGPADDDAMERVAKLASDLLANPVIEEF